MPAGPRNAAAWTLPEVISLGTCIFDPVWAEKTHESSSCELLHVVQGQVALVLGEDTFRAGPGDTLVVPDDTSHRDEFDLEEGLEVFMVHFRWSDQDRFAALVRNDTLLALPKPSQDELVRLFERLQTDSIAPGEADLALAQARVFHILMFMYREAQRMQPDDVEPEEPSYGDRRRRQLMLDAKKYLEDHYAGPIALDDIATFLGVSPFYLSHVFSQESDFSLFSYLTTLRVRHARELLEAGEEGRSVAEVAYAVGYESPSYFSKVFKAHTGLSPRNVMARTG